MAFCKYCGAQLEEGQQCNCEGAQAARTAATNPQPQATNGAANVNQTAEAAKAVATNVGLELLDVCKKFFTSPAELLEEVYTATSQLSQFVIAGIFVLVSLIFMSLLMNGVDSPFLVGLAITVALVVAKVVYAVAAYLFKNTNGSFVNTLGLFCITFIPGTIFTLVLFLFAKMSFIVGVIALLLVWMIVDSVYSYLSFKTVIKDTKVKALNVFFVTAIIITFILVAIGYNKIMDIVTEMVSNAIYGSFGSFLD